MDASTRVVLPTAGPTVDRILTSHCEGLGWLRAFMYSLSREPIHKPVLIFGTHLLVCIRSQFILHARSSACATRVIFC